MRISESYRRWAAVAVLASAGTAAHAATVYVYTIESPPALWRFATDDPAHATRIGAISGVRPGHELQNIDFRPANGRLYGLSSDIAEPTVNQLYTIDLATAVATPVGTPLILPGKKSLTALIDFDPVRDVLRVTTYSRDNYVVEPETGTLKRVASRLDTGHLIAALAYTAAPAGDGAATLYAYDYTAGTLVTIGGRDGDPPANTGLVFTIGPTGSVQQSDYVGFDIDADGRAWFAGAEANDNDTDDFYAVDLATGAFTFVGPIGAGGGVPLVFDAAVQVRPDRVFRDGFE